MRPFVERLLEADDLPAALTELAGLLQDAVLAPDVVQMRRLVAAESDRFPDVAATYLADRPEARSREARDVTAERAEGLPGGCSQSRTGSSEVASDLARAQPSPGIDCHHRADRAVTADPHVTRPVNAEVAPTAPNWRYAVLMPSIQVKDVPDDVHATLRKRAAAAGKSLQEYLLAHLVAEATQPTLEEVLERAGQRAGGRVTTRDAVEAVRADRESR